MKAYQVQALKTYAREYREACEFHAQMEHMAEKSEGYEGYEDYEDFAYRIMWSAYITYTNAIAEWCGMSRKAARKLVNEKPMSTALAIDTLRYED